MRSDLFLICWFFKGSVLLICVLNLIWLFCRWNIFILFSNGLLIDKISGKLCNDVFLIGSFSYKGFKFIFRLSVLLWLVC